MNRIKFMFLGLTGPIFNILGCFILKSSLYTYYTSLQMLSSSVRRDGDGHHFQVPPDMSVQVWVSALSGSPKDILDRDDRDVSEPLLCYHSSVLVLCHVGTWTFSPVWSSRELWVKVLLLCSLIVFLTLTFIPVSASEWWCFVPGSVFQNNPASDGDSFDLVVYDMFHSKGSVSFIVCIYMFFLTLCLFKHWCAQSQSNSGC